MVNYDLVVGVVNSGERIGFDVVAKETIQAFEEEVEVTVATFFYIHGIFYRAFYVVRFREIIYYFTIICYAILYNSEFL